MLHPLAQDGIYRITRDFSRDDLLAFFVAFHDRIRELDEVARRERRRPASQDDIDRLDLPVVVGSAILRRPSVAAVQWLRECAVKWWGHSSRTYSIALAYACAHREQAAFDALGGRLRARMICWRWALGIRASEEALRRAAIALTPPADDSLSWFASPDDDPENPAPDLAEVALSLSKHYGGTPAHWTWEVAEDDFWKAVCGIADAKDAEREEAVKDDADSWWRRHRRALLACEGALEASAKAWADKRRPEKQDAPASNVEPANG